LSNSTPAWAGDGPSRARESPARARELIGRSFINGAAAAGSVY
jgi:hypothetical protein